MNQEVKYIHIKDLVLWTENPRDPIDPHATDQDIIDRALKDRSDKWSLKKLAKKMGDYYDLSELPTVVYTNDKPVVYDGNRRIVLAKIKHELVSDTEHINFKIPDFPEKIPCNVCEESTALRNVYRKHSDTGSWQPLERDIFLHKHMGQEKSPFLILEENTGIVSANPHLNKTFVRDEIFKEDTLKAMGFDIASGQLQCVHDDQEARSILSDVADKVKDKTISTRENRGRVIEVLEPNSQQFISDNKDKNYRHSSINFKENSPEKNLKSKPRSRRTKKKESEIFGGRLVLKSGKVNNLYRDITELYSFYLDNRNTLSQTFPNLIRMSLRLLCEAAAESKKMEQYLKKNFADAKKTLDNDAKTTLSSQNVTEDSIVGLLHTGAHDYSASSNVPQTLAISIIVGAILIITHGKE